MTVDISAVADPAVSVAPAPPDSVPSKPVAPAEPAELDGTTPKPEAPYVVLSGLAAARYNGRIGQVLYPVTDEKGVSRWAVRLSSTESIRVPVDNCTRVTEGEVVKWELDERRAAHRAELESKGMAEKFVEVEAGTRPFPAPLHTYVLAMDDFYRGHLTTGEDVRVHEFAKLFDQFEVDVCSAVASEIGDAHITEAMARTALDGHMSRSARYKAASERYIRLAEDDTAPSDEAESVSWPAAQATAPEDGAGVLV